MYAWSYIRLHKNDYIYRTNTNFCVRFVAQCLEVFKDSKYARKKIVFFFMVKRYVTPPSPPPLIYSAVSFNNSTVFS